MSKKKKENIPAWLRSAVIYQVYPQSFRDSNGDGIGDIGGVIEKLDYIRSLGCDVIWLTPVFVSPFRDAGYDVSDFCRVAPRYGTNRDLGRLFREAHRRGMKVVLDLVAAHTSIEHPWFRDSAARRPGRFARRYIWTGSVWEKEPGLRFVRGYGERNGNYLANFFWFQPALNYGFARPDPEKPWQISPRHPEVRRLTGEMTKIMRFWLDRGADGFRIDMAFSMVKNDPDQAATVALWRTILPRMRKEYPQAAFIAEWSRPDRAIRAGFHIDFLLHFASGGYTSLFRAEDGRNLYPGTGGRSFFDRAGRGDITRFTGEYLGYLAPPAGEGYVSIPSGNHDLPRISLGRTREDLEVVFACLLTLPGVPAIYYGDEIGMRYLPDLPSKEGGYNRTGSRTPMQWDGTSRAGFSRALPSRFYLPLDPDPDRPSVAAQENDPGSLLNRVRGLIALRRENPALGPDGSFKVRYAKKNRYPFIYERALGDARFLVVLNPSGRKVRASCPSGPRTGRTELIQGRGVLLSWGKEGLKAECAPCSYALFRF